MMFAEPERPPAEGQRKHNRLIHEKSPYLLAHADNPVDWYPWGDEAFEKARREDKPVFLSIGYSTCHWCHVMAHESFEDPQVAALMNDAFVCIKVDREERPDLDDVYMTVAQMMTGRGGWPLSILLTPDKVPFFAATYIPKANRFGHAGMLTLIPAVQERWRTRRHELLDVASRVTSALQESAQSTPGGDLDLSTLTLAYEQLAQRFDAENGGFGSAPKFPTPHNLMFLLRYWRRSGDATALHMVEKTLQAMRRGGVFDQVGFGFHRYSTDARWLLPHFEKMLYDQAMLAMAYTEAHQATGKAEYRRAAQQVLSYVVRDMTSSEGGFCSAEDADSEGEEGKFYLWTAEELRQVLGEEDSKLVARAFGVLPQGNYAEEATGRRTGSNVLYLPEPLSQVAADWGKPEAELEARVESARRKLFVERERRIRPLKDDKVLADWNGLMIAALARAALAFDEPALAEAAERASAFILQKLVDADGRLLHRYRDGEAALRAYAEDYAFLTWGLLELYEATFKVVYLEQALALNEALMEHFWDERAGGLYSTAHDAEELLVRRKEVYDGAIPSANSVALWNLLRLARLTANADLEEKGAQLTGAFSGQVAASPMAHTLFLVGLDFALGPAYEVVIAGDARADDTISMLRALRAAFVPNKVVLFRPDGKEPPPITAVAEFTRPYRSIDGQATAYVCLSGNCQLPTMDVSVMLGLLGANR